MVKLNPLTKFILKRPWLKRWVEPLSEWYVSKMGYQQIGLKMEDLLPEEDEVTQLALKRLPPREAYDRVFRLRRAFQVCVFTFRSLQYVFSSSADSLHLQFSLTWILLQLSLSHQILPEEEWTKPQDVSLSEGLKTHHYSPRY